MKRLRRLLVSWPLVLLAACGSDDAGTPPVEPPPATRSFHLGFSPWPWDATAAAVDWTWATVRAEGDLVSHHLEEGVPWPQVAAGVDTPWPVSYQGLITRHRQEGHGRFHLVSINALNVGRDGLAPLRGEQVNQPLPAPWSGAALDSEAVKAAYVNYARRMSAELAPDVLLTGIEVNLLIEKNPALWPAFVALQCHTYQALKASHPGVPVGVSLFALALLPEWSGEYDLAQQQTALAQLAPCVDVVAWSVYPYMSSLLADSLPADFFARFVARLPEGLRGKPMGISESGYPAQTWSLQGLTWNGTPAKQRDMVALMLSEAQRLDMRFVAWFTVRDYDALWAGALGEDPIALIWRDAGLFDESGLGREALGTWRSWKARGWVQASTLHQE
jgi:hypothetical protein